MIIGQVAKKPEIDRFLYWVKERHTIYKKKNRGLKRPWTDDSVLQNYFFTNPFRENDKVTQWFRNNIRGPLSDDARVLFATICFRWFNKPSTGDILLGGDRVGWNEKRNLITNWNEKEAVKRLKKVDGPVFTGAYMIKAGNGPRGSKVPSVCKAITSAWNIQDELLSICEGDCRLEALWKGLKQIKFLGPFMSYEVVCDLRYTYLLENATDVETWCNVGPGARRGMNRMLKSDRLNAPIPKDVWREKTTNLMKEMRKLKLGQRVEMREVEHSLCEWDKYERALEGRTANMKRRYRGV